MRIFFLKSELKVKIMGNPQNYRATRCHKRGDLRRLATTLNLFINKMSMAILSVFLFPTDLTDEKWRKLEQCNAESD